MAMESSRTFLPAAGVDWLLPLYDPFVKLIGAEKARKDLLDRADLTSGLRVLDIGCGTGTFTVSVKKEYPKIEVIGLDPDPKALARAKQKAKEGKAVVQFDQGFSDELPFSGNSFDRVFSSFMFHHLPPDVKVRTLSEVIRVLKPGGSFNLLDFGGPESGGHGILTHLFHPNHRLEANSEDSVLALLRDAGFSHAEKTAEGRMFFGLIEVNYFRATVQN